MKRKFGVVSAHATIGNRSFNRNTPRSSRMLASIQSISSRATGSGGPRECSKIRRNGESSQAPPPPQPSHGAETAPSFRRSTPSREPAQIWAARSIADDKFAGVAYRTRSPPARFPPAPSLCRWVYPNPPPAMHCRSSGRLPTGTCPGTCRACAPRYRTSIRTSIKSVRGQSVHPCSLISPHRARFVRERALRRAVFSILIRALRPAD